MRKWYRHVMAVKILEILMNEYLAGDADVEAILAEVGKLWKQAKKERAEEDSQHE